MVKIYKVLITKGARLYLRYGLVFFLLMIFVACNHPRHRITLVWKNQRATAIQIPQSLNIDDSKLRVVVAGNDKAILGNFSTNVGVILFEPLIPLSPGLSYNILEGDKVVGNIKIPVIKSDAPVLAAIYPESDTLPENTLKFYLRFSKPMRMGQSLNYIYLLDKNKDTMRNVFLNLQPELWDTSGKVLTVWIDPGRIKRDLVLNRQLGNPLKRSETYQLIIAPQWKDSYGISMGKQYTKQFIVAQRNSRTPNVTAWQLNIPKAGTTSPLIITTNEPLDHYLLQECVTVVNETGTVKGTVTTGDKDKLWKFTPLTAWKPGHYKLKVKTNLEDLAGNNLNRVFDRDITKDASKDKDFEIRDFEVR